MSADSRFRLGERWVDPSAGDIDGVRVDARAMEVLIALAEAAPDVLSVGALLERVWPNVVVVDNVVHQAIAQLRRALGDEARSPRYIGSVPRRGYRLIAEIRRDEPGSIAVLRFVDMTPEQDQAALCAGIAEEILNRLARTGDLKVIGRTSSFQFDPNDANIREISRRLGVRHVLEGSVRTEGNQVRISAHLIECDGESQRWSAGYTRELIDLFTLYDEVAEAIARALNLVISDGRPRSTSAPTHSQEALKLVMRARFTFEETGHPRASFALVERALELDPDYAEAHLAQGILHFAFASDASDESPKPHLLAARECLEKALLLDSDLADAHEYLGFVRAHLDLDWGLGAESWRRADQLRGYPRRYVAHFWAGHYEQVERECLRHIERDPLNVDMNRWLAPRRWLARALDRLGRADEATQVYEATLALAPSHRTILVNFVQHLCWFARDAERAERVLNAAQDIRRGARSYLRALIAHERGESGPLRSIVEAIAGRWPEYYALPSTIAFAFYRLGDYGKYIFWYAMREGERDTLPLVPTNVRDEPDYWERLTDWALDDPAEARTRMALVNDHRALIDRITERMVLPHDY
jgi:TolB-like protein